MTKILAVKPENINANPHRMLGKYPISQSKVDALISSIHSVGLWEGMIARKHNGKYELAFGHHRLEAAKQAGLETIPLIVRNLNDEQMLQFMGRENLEEFNTDFEVMYSAWEAATIFLTSQEKTVKSSEKDLVITEDSSQQHRAKSKITALQVGKLLGWVRPDTQNTVRLTDTAQACANTYDLIQQTDVKEKDLSGLSIRRVRNITTTAKNQLKIIDKVAGSDHCNLTPAKAAQAKEVITKAVKITATAARAGKIKDNKISTEVTKQINMITIASRKRPAKIPMFSTFGSKVTKSIDRFCNDDALIEKINQIIAAKDQIELTEDKQVIADLRTSLTAVITRLQSLQQKV